MWKAGEGEGGGGLERYSNAFKFYWWSSYYDVPGSICTFIYILWYVYRCTCSCIVVPGQGACQESQRSRTIVVAVCHQYKTYYAWKVNIPINKELLTFRHFSMNSYHFLFNKLRNWSPFFFSYLFITNSLLLDRLASLEGLEVNKYIYLHREVVVGIPKSQKIWFFDSTPPSRRRLFKMRSQCKWTCFRDSRIDLKEVFFSLIYNVT